ncbi:MAG: peroxide stress protein YaaA [Bacteroidota bacterium]|nr:peroxide stress protein YaaA [Bacteroidota bacterium]MEC8636486.1 peroxide stress protein YaaA [Bacteroidota bacterium]
MKMVISPAKSLNFESNLPTEQNSNPCFLAEANRINELLKKKTPAELSQLMKISEKLGNLNWERNQNFKIPFNKENARPAVYAFDGDVYAGLDVYTLPLEKIQVLQDNLRILSGLYGVLKPLDLIQPYRLEMGTKFRIDKKNNLYGFWKQKITTFINDELEEKELFVNLASNEYFSAIDSKVLKTAVITPQFKDFKNGTLKMISFYAKKARGMMVRYLLDKENVTAETLLDFDYGGYAYSEEHTKSPLAPVFIR